MTLIQLRYLLAIADSGLNISLAASRIHVTQPALSRQIKQLEEELGVILFVRGVRSLKSITSEGKEIIEHARILLGEVASIRAVAAHSRNDQSALSAASGVPNHRCPHVWLHFRLRDESKLVPGPQPGVSDCPGNA